MRHQQQVHPEKFDHKLDRDESDYNADEEDDIESAETNSNISKTEEKDIDDYIRSSDDDLEGKEDFDKESDEDVDENIPHKYNLWKYLKQRALKKNHIISKYNDAVKELSSRDDWTEINATRLVLPEIRKSIFKDYEQLLFLWHYADEDESHQKIMDTKRRLVEDDEYEDEEAIRYAIKKRRYLIQKETNTLNDDHEESTHDEEETDDEIMD